MKDHIAQQKEIERLQRMVRASRASRLRQPWRSQSRKAIDRMVIIEAPDKYDNKTFHANFQPEKETGNDVLYTSELAIGYDHPLSVVSLDLKRGEKLGILGGNGLGKSTFLKTIVGKIPALYRRVPLWNQRADRIFRTSRWPCIQATRLCSMIFGMSIRISRKPRPEMHSEPFFFQGMTCSRT